MMFSHLVRASLSSILRKFSINLLSCRFMSSTFVAGGVVVSFNFVLARPRGLWQISQTTLADEFSYVHAGHCHILTIVLPVLL